MSSNDLVLPPKPTHEPFSRSIFKRKVNSKTKDIPGNDIYDREIQKHTHHNQQTNLQQYPHQYTQHNQQKHQNEPLFTKVYTQNQSPQPYNPIVPTPPSIGSSKFSRSYSNQRTLTPKYQNTSKNLSPTLSTDAAKLQINSAPSSARKISDTTNLSIRNNSPVSAVPIPISVGISAPSVHPPVPSLPLSSLGSTKNHQGTQGPTRSDNAPIPSLSPRPKMTPRRKEEIDANVIKSMYFEALQKRRAANILRREKNIHEKAKEWFKKKKSQMIQEDMRIQNIIRVEKEQAAYHERERLEGVHNEKNLNKLLNAQRERKIAERETRRMIREATGTATIKQTKTLQRVFTF